MKTRHTRTAAIAAAAVLGLAACGGATDEPTDATATDEADASVAETSDDDTDEMSDADTSDEGEMSEGGMSEGDETSDDATGEMGDTGDGTVVTTTDSPFGTVLVTGDGMAVYGFTQDEDGESNCTGGCAQTWPPVLLGSDDVPEGLDDEVYGVTTRDDGSWQLTAGPWPLYTYAPDTEGTFNGQGVGDSWFVVSPVGELVEDEAEPGAGDDGY